MVATSYRNVDLDLSSVVTPEQKRPVDGAQSGVTIYGVYIVAANYLDNPLPVGAQVKLSFGQNDPIILTDELTSFEFPCGMDEGVFYTNEAALATKVLRLLIDYSGMGIGYAD